MNVLKVSAKTGEGMKEYLEFLVHQMCETESAKQKDLTMR
jgi:translation elongation factor EF-4